MVWDAKVFYIALVILVLLIGLSLKPCRSLCRRLRRYHGNKDQFPMQYETSRRDGSPWRSRAGSSRFKASTAASLEHPKLEKPAERVTFSLAETIAWKPVPGELREPPTLRKLNQLGGQFAKKYTLTLVSRSPNIPQMAMTGFAGLDSAVQAQQTVRTLQRTAGSGLPWSQKSRRGTVDSAALKEENEEAVGSEISQDEDDGDKNLTTRSSQLAIKADTTDAIALDMMDTGCKVNSIKLMKQAASLKNYVGAFSTRLN